MYFTYLSVYVKIKRITIVIVAEGIGDLKAGKYFLAIIS